MDWSQILTTSGVLGALGIAAAAYFKARPHMKLAELQSEAALWKRIAALEAKAEQQDLRLAQEREMCDERINRIEARHSEDVTELKNEIQTLRHDRNNVRQALNAMFVMLKQDECDVPQVVAAIEDMLTRGDEVIAVEKATMASLRRDGQ